MMNGEIMPRWRPMPLFTDERGSLSVCDAPMPFAVRRVFVLHDLPPGARRGGHRHRRNRLALLCLGGTCEALVRAQGIWTLFRLESPSAWLLLEPGDWHELRAFSPGASVVALASDAYDPDDVAEGFAP